MKQRKYVTQTLRNNRDIANEMMILYYINLAVRKSCRKCPKVLDKHQKNNEQDLNVITELKPYCPKCRNLIKMLYSKIDEKVAE